MTYTRVVRRNRLHGDYGVRVDNTEEPPHFLRSLRRIAPEGEFDLVSGASIAGDMRRLEQDTMDANHLAMYAGVSGATVEQVRRIFEHFFVGYQ